MKAKLTTVVCVLAMGLACTTNAWAVRETDPAATACDALVVRPVSLVATVVGAAVFVVSLPLAVPTKSVKSAADALVMTPARFTFKRQLGDFENRRVRLVPPRRVYYSGPSSAPVQPGQPIQSGQPRR